MATIVRFLHCLLLPLLLALATATHADTGRRVALVIGNGAYQNAPGLPNPPNDAKAVAAALRGLGFEVIEAVNLDQPDMLTRVDEFSARLEGADVGLFFYAGHGLQVAGENYLVPIDARLQREAQVRLQTLPLQTVLATMEASVQIRLVLLDACRDNPLVQQLKRSMGASRSQAVGQGLAEVRTAVGTLIAYATGPGDVAADGQGEHSPFTGALLDHIATPGLEVRQVLGRVRNEVLQQTGDRQVPWDSSSLRGEFYFKEMEAVVAALEPGVLEPTAGPAPAFDERQADLSFWNAIVSSRKGADFDAYLNAFPNGIFAGLARSRLEDLRKAADPQEDGKPQLSPELEQTQPTPPAPTPSEALATVPTLPPASNEPTPASTEASLGLSRSSWTGIQRALAVLGYDAGGVDGRPGPNTRTAVASWQRGRGMEATGYFSAKQESLLSAEAEPLLRKLKETAEAPQKTQPASADIGSQVQSEQNMEKVSIGKPEAVEPILKTTIEPPLTQQQLQRASRKERNKGRLSYGFWITNNSGSFVENVQVADKSSPDKREMRVRYLNRAAEEYIKWYERDCEITIYYLQESVAGAKSRSRSMVRDICDETEVSIR